MLESKLQLKPGSTIAITGAPAKFRLEAPSASPDQADTVLIFTVNLYQLDQALTDLKLAASAAKVTWVAYPKGGGLGTDLNRDRIRDWANARGLDPVRQIAIDAVWSALRLKALG